MPSRATRCLSSGRSNTSSDPQGLYYLWVAGAYNYDGIQGCASPGSFKYSVQLEPGGAGPQPDLHAWFRTTFGALATYADVLRSLTAIGVRSLTCRPPTLEEIFLKQYSPTVPA